MQHFLSSSYSSSSFSYLLLLLLLALLQLLLLLLILLFFFLFFPLLFHGYRLLAARALLARLLALSLPQSHCLATIGLLTVTLASSDSPPPPPIVHLFCLVAISLTSPASSCRPMLPPARPSTAVTHR